jgi:hypothetical protein
MLGRDGMFMTGGASAGFASDAGGGGGAVITRLADAVV